MTSTSQETGTGTRRMTPHKQLAGNPPHDKTHAPWWTAQWPLLTAIAWLALLLTAGTWWWLERDTLGQLDWQSPTPIVQHETGTSAEPKFAGGIDMAKDR